MNPLRIASTTHGAPYDQKVEGRLIDALEDVLALYGAHGANPIPDDRSEIVLPSRDRGRIRASSGHNRGFQLIAGDGADEPVYLTCPILDWLTDEPDAATSTMHHAQWALRILTSPRTGERDDAMQAIAQDVVDLCAIVDEDPDAAVSSTIVHHDDGMRITIDSTGSLRWNRDVPEGITRYARETWIPSVHVEYARKDWRSKFTLVTIGYDKIDMAFAKKQNPIEAMRTILRTGVDPTSMDWSQTGRSA